MRNLKRVLSLTLASVMLMGMMVVGSAAKGYDDVSETDNVEAIEVLQEIEVMVGDDRGFGPERPVNRAEMAVVMGKLLNLDYNYYASSCPFTDVYDWAQGWVGACYANKIVSGRGDGIYDPGATVTAVEAASMLMRALGYFRYQNDYADGFELATVTQGTKIGIFEDVGSSASEPMTRNQVAQMVLNALQCGMVQPDGNTINLTTPDGSVLTGKVNYVYVTSSKAYATSISRTQATSMGSANDFTIVELGEQLYNGELKLYGEGSNIADREWDVFGRPARRWEYKGQEIGTYVKKELLKQEYTAKVTGQTLYELLGKSTIDTYHFQIEIDGIQTSGVNPDANASTDLGSAYFTKDDLYRTNKDAVGRTGNGVLTQVYVDTEFAKSNADSSTYWVYISVINTYLAKSNEDYDTKNDDVQLRAWRLENKNTTASPVFVKSAVANNVNVDKSKDFCDIYAKGEDFSIVPDVKKDDLYLITVADGEIQTIEAPEVLSAVTVDAFKLFDHVTTGGQQYNHATTARYDVEAIENWTSSDGTLNLKEMTYNVILDDYGYLIGLERNEDANQYVFLTGLEAGASNLYAKQVDGNIIHLDGTMETVKIDLKKSRCGQYNADGTAHTNHSLLAHNSGAGQHTNLSQLNTWCTYSVDSSGVYTLKMVPVADTANVTNSTNIKIGQYAQDVGRFNDGTSNGKVTKSINTKRVSLNASSAEKRDYVYGNDDTVYLTVDLEKVVVDDTFGGSSRWIIDEVDTVVTGVKNANLVAEELGTVDDKVGFTYPTAEIYTLYDNKGIVIAAVVIGEDEGASSSYAYIHSSGLDEESYAHSSSTRSGDGEWTWTRKAIVNGEIVTLKEVGADPEYLHPSKMAQGEWYEIKYGADGTVRRAEKLVYKTENEWPVVNVNKWIAKVVDVEASVDEYNTVILRDTTTVDGLSYKNGTLYTAQNETRGFSVDPDVKTVLALAGKNGDGNGKDWFDTTTDGYNGYIGLEQALREMNAPDYSDFDEGSVEIMALFQNGRATTIIINDKNPAPDNKPSGGSKPGGGTTGSITAANGVAVKPNGTSYGTAEINKFSNTASVSIQFMAPGEWAEVNVKEDVNIKYTVKVNGEKLGEYSTGTGGVTSLTNKVYTFNDTAAKADLNNGLTAGTITSSDKITVEITEVTWKYAGVKYVHTDGTEVKADALTNANSKLIIDTTGEALKIQYTLGSDTGYEADGQLTYKVDNAVKCTGETKDLSGNLVDNTDVGLTKVAAKGGDFVKVTIGGVKATAPATESNIEVAAGLPSTLKFAVVDTEPTTQTDVNNITTWSDAPLKAASGKHVVVKSAVDGVKLTNLTLNNKDYSASAPTATEIGTGSGVFKFAMGTKDIIVTAAPNNSVTVEKGYVYNDGTDDILNLRLASGNVALATATAEDKARTAQAAKTWLESKGYTATINQTNGVVASVSATKGSESYTIEIANITGANNLGYATIKTADGSVNVEVVNNSAFSTTAYSAVLALLGITKMEDSDTIGSSARHLFVTPKDSTTAAVKAVTGSATAGDTIDIGKMIDTDKASGYVELTFAVAGNNNSYIGDGSNDSETITGLAAAITKHDGVKYDTNKLYVMGDEGVTITIGITCNLPNGKGSKGGLKATAGIGDTGSNKLEAVSGSATEKELIAASTSAVSADTDCSTTIQIRITPQTGQHVANDTITVNFAKA